MKNTIRQFAIVALVFAMYALCACSALQSGVTKVENDIATKAQTVSTPDLENAKTLAAAQLADPAKSEDILCFNDVEAYEAAVVAATAPLPSSTAVDTGNPLLVGVATGLVDLQQAGQTPISITSNIPPVPHKLIADCAVVVVDAKLVIAKFGLEAGAIGAAIKTGQLQGAASVLSKLPKTP